MSFDLKTNSVIESEVLSLVSRTDTEYFLLNDFLRVTAKHPFYTERGWVKAEDLQVGKMIYSLDGWQPLEKKELVKEKIEVFTLSVSNPDNYFAGGFLVHNKEEEIGRSINLTAGIPSGGNTPAGQVRILLPAGSGTGSDGNLAIFTANGGMIELLDTDPSGLGIMVTIMASLIGSANILAIEDSLWILDQDKVVDGCVYFPNWFYNASTNLELAQICMDSDDNTFKIMANDVGIVLDFDTGETFIISQNGTERITITNVLTTIKTTTTEVGKLIVNRAGTNNSPIIIQGTDFIGNPFKPGFAIWNNGKTAESVWTWANKNNIFHFATFAPSNQNSTGTFRIDASDGAFWSDANGTIDGNLDVGENLNVDGELRFFDAGNNYVGFDAPTLSANQIWVLPDIDGKDGDVMFTDGSGSLKWGANASTRAFTFSSPSGGSGITYAGGHYRFGATDNDFNPSITFGTANIAYGDHLFIVCAAGGGGGTDTVIRITGTSITDEGVRTVSDTEDLTADDAGVAGAYYETPKKWLGQVTIAKQSGPDLLCNYGGTKYWDDNNENFKVEGIEATWLGGANDATPNLKLIHHKATGWTYNAGSTPTPPTAIATMNIDYVTEIQVSNGEEGAWKRTNLSTNVNGSDGEGTIIEIVTTANKTFEIGNILLRVVPQ